LKQHHAAHAIKRKMIEPMPSKKHCQIFPVSSITTMYKYLNYEEAYAGELACICVKAVKENEKLIRKTFCHGFDQ